MMDNLEKFVIDHREDFDDAIPDLRVWGAINQVLEEKAQAQKNAFAPQLQVASTATKQVSLWASVRRYAAAAVFILGLAYTGLFLKNNKPSALAANLDKTELQDISPEYKEVEQYYVRKIAYQTKALQTKPHDASINQDLEQIDQVMLELQQEMTNAPKGSREKIIATMINNYKTKVEILEKVLQE